jgi:hypothetical protein
MKPMHWIKWKRVLSSAAALGLGLATASVADAEVTIQLTRKKSCSLSDAMFGYFPTHWHPWPMAPCGLDPLPVEGATPVAPPANNVNPMSRVPRPTSVQPASLNTRGADPKAVPPPAKSH